MMLRQPQTRLGLLLLGGSLVLGAGGCATGPTSKESVTGGNSSGNPQPGTTAQVTIVVRRGPLGPVELVGHESSAPVAGAIVTIRDQQDHEVARALSDTAGRAQVSIAPGEYRVVLLSCPGARIPEPFPVLLLGGAADSLGVLCDTERQ
jgi:hypothetical protein